MNFLHTLPNHKGQPTNCLVFKSRISLSLPAWELWPPLRATCLLRSLADQRNLPRLRETMWAVWLGFLLFIQEELRDPEDVIHICPEALAMRGDVWWGEKWCQRSEKRCSWVVEGSRRCSCTEERCVCSWDTCKGSMCKLCKVLWLYGEMYGCAGKRHMYAKRDMQLFVKRCNCVERLPGKRDYSRWSKREGYHRESLCLLLFFLSYHQKVCVSFFTRRKKSLAQR